MTINHLKVISLKASNKNNQDDLGKEYFTFTSFNESVIGNACKFIEKNTVDLKINIFKKNIKILHNEKSINHNIILYLLYENIKNRPVFKNFEKIIHRKKILTKINQPFELII